MHILKAGDDFWDCNQSSCEILFTVFWMEYEIGAWNKGVFFRHHPKSVHEKSSFLFNNSLYQLCCFPCLDSCIGVTIWRFFFSFIEVISCFFILGLTNDPVIRYVGIVGSENMYSSFMSSKYTGLCFCCFFFLRCTNKHFGFKFNMCFKFSGIPF